MSDYVTKCQLCVWVCHSVSVTWTTVSFNHTEEGLYIINFQVVVLSFKAAAKWIIKSGVGGRWVRWLVGVGCWWGLGVGEGVGEEDLPGGAWEKIDI